MIRRTASLVLPRNFKTTDMACLTRLSALLGFLLLLQQGWVHCSEGTRFLQDQYSASQVAEEKGWQHYTASWVRFEAAIYPTDIDQCRAGPDLR